jgi:hypothetical protein
MRSSSENGHCMPLAAITKMKGRSPRHKSVLLRVCVIGACHTPRNVDALPVVHETGAYQYRSRGKRFATYLASRVITCWRYVGSMRLHSVAAWHGARALTESGHSVNSEMFSASQAS